MSTPEKTCPCGYAFLDDAYCHHWIGGELVLTKDEERARAKMVKDKKIGIRFNVTEDRGDEEVPLQLFRTTGCDRGSNRVEVSYDGRKFLLTVAEAEELSRFLLDFLAAEGVLKAEAPPRVEVSEGARNEALKTLLAGVDFKEENGEEIVRIKNPLKFRQACIEARELVEWEKA